MGKMPRHAEPIGLLDVYNYSVDRYVYYYY
jgi:hypothetical protein